MLKSNTLTPTQKLELQTIYDSSDKTRFRNRCQGILLIDQGMSIKETVFIYKVRIRWRKLVYKSSSLAQAFACAHNSEQTF